MGMAALLPGMQHMIDTMQEHIDNFKKVIEAAESGEQLDLRKKENRFSNYQEIVSRGKQKTVNHPRNPDHPKHKEWVRKIQAARNASVAAKKASA
jgi:hypothetical protein